MPAHGNAYRTPFLEKLRRTLHLLWCYRNYKPKRTFLKHNGREDGMEKTTKGSFLICRQKSGRKQTMDGEKDKQLNSVWKKLSWEEIIMNIRRCLAVLLSVLLLLCLAGSSALAAYQYCPFCGQNLENKEYAYCPYCGNKLEAEQSGGSLGSLSDLISHVSAREFEISSSVSMNHGWATVSWTDSENKGPYKVYYRYADGINDNQLWFWAGGNESESTTSSKSFTSENLIPGKQYVIAVEDGDGNEIQKTVRIPDAPSFVDGKLQASSLKVKLAPRFLPRSSADAKSAKTLNKFVSSQMDFVSNYYGLRLEISHPQLGKERHYPCLIAFYAPNSFVWSYYDPDFNMATFQNGGSTYYYCVGTGFFDEVNETFGSMVRGSYRVEVFFDGMYVGSNTFNVD